jgi:hypothetical protein
LPPAPACYSAFSIEKGKAEYTCQVDTSVANFSELRLGEVRRLPLLRRWVNGECEGLRCIPLADQGEAVVEAEDVAVVVGTVFSGVRTVPSTVMGRVAGAGGAASSGS